MLPPVVLAVSAIVWIQYHRARTELLGAVDKEIRYLAQRTALSVDEQLHQSFRDLFTLAETPLIADHYRNVDFQLLDEAESYRRELERFLGNFAERNKAYARIYYLAPDGREIVRVPKSAPAESHARRDYLEKARAAGPGGWWSSSMRQLPTGELAVYFSKPIRDERGAFRGALVLCWDLAPMRERLGGIEIGRTGRAIIRTADGLVLQDGARPPPAGELLSASSELKRQAWTVVVEAPAEDFLGPLRGVRDAALLTSLLGLLVLIGLLFWVVRSITRPIAELATAARLIGRGELSHRVGYAGQDELGSLAGAFNEMAEGLETNRKLNAQLQSQLIQAEKLSAVGQLISAVAHELNNPLGAISGYVQIAMLDPLPPRMKKDLQHVFNNVLRCRKVVENLLFFVRQSRHERKRVDLNECVRSALELLEYRLKKTEDVKVVAQLAERPPEVVGDFQQIVQVLVNLVSNACDAMQGVVRYPEGKRLVLRTCSEGDAAVMLIEDNGPGIPPELRDRIFQAFFTTKEAGRGTGLGLSICKQIVEEHGGDVSFTTREGKGTTFRVELPAGREEEFERLELPDEPVQYEPVPGKRILVADDEKDIAELIARLLVEDGDEVEIALHGSEAVARVERERYDLVISDMEMEAAKGQDLFAKMIERDGAAGGRILFVTGDVLNPKVLEFLSRTGCAYLVKPFDIHELRQTVRRMLAGVKVA